MAIRTLFQNKLSLRGRSCWIVNIRMDDAEKLSREAMGRFVGAKVDARFASQGLAASDTKTHSIELANLLNSRGRVE